jgi:16S rRNA (cytosine967-C5)-methyltransferase
MSASPARLAALWEIDQRPLPGWPARSMRRLRRFRLSDPRDIDLAENITQGVIKQTLVLQRLATEYSGRSLAQIDVPLQKILAVAMYQLRSLSRVPTHAVVDDAVEQAKHAGLGSGSGFVNAVLRKAARDRAAGEAVQASDSAVRAEFETSVPREVFHRFAKLYGEAKALDLCNAVNREPPILARLIGDTTIEQLSLRGVEAVPHEQPRIVVLKNARQSELRELSDANLCQPQDATSAATVDHLGLKAGLRVLDRCCGRGTKTQQIVEQVGREATVVAMDPSADRLAQLRTMLDARSIKNVQVVNAGMVDALGPDAEFDRVLVDAPCSNSGVFARRPEARYHQSRQHVARIVELQKRIVIDSAMAVASGGLLVYATCSVWPEENDGIVDAFLKRNERFTEVRRTSIEPCLSEDQTRYHDGGFVAVLQRRP